MSATNQFPPPHLIPDDDENHNSSQDKPSQDATTNQPQQQLALPSTETDTTTPTSTQQLHVSSSPNTTKNDDIRHTISFNHLGPLVVNKDGTLSRIHNWAEMGDAERERTVRVLGKRNMLRKEAILKDEDGVSGS